MEDVENAIAQPSQSNQEIIPSTKKEYDWEIGEGQKPRPISKVPGHIAWLRSVHYYI